jgi:hypothetical protein
MIFLSFAIPVYGYIVGLRVAATAKVTVFGDRQMYTRYGAAPTH